MSIPKRIVSLLPAATEMVCFLGESARLVGRSHECDFPEQTLSLPVCTSSNVDAKASSKAIDDSVKSISSANNPIYVLDTALIKQLRPDLIITQAQCDVCAISLVEVQKLVDSWPSQNHPRIITLSPTRLADVWNDLRNISETLGLGDSGKELIRILKNRVVTIIEKTCIIEKRPKVVCLEWTEPLMAAGNWVPELVELAGGKDVCGTPGKHSAWMDWDLLLKQDPDFIIAMPCGFDMERTRSEMKPLTLHPLWKKLQAVRGKQVFVVDGNSYFNRPGPRLVESIEILAEILQPKLFHFGHEGKAWSRL
jgi:iron complex transport system substrate-binding protein